MPFGLKNAPASFQRMMDSALRGLIGKICFVYLDDIVVFGRTLKEHNENLITFFERLRATGLKLQPDNCECLHPELEYLGHLITENGVEPNPNKLEAVKNFKKPINAKDVRSFLGLGGYYRKFIKNFSTIAKPLTDLTKKDHTFDWTPKCEESFQKIKNCLCSAPVLKFPDYQEQFILTTDASNVGLGAILSQKGHPIHYVSRVLTEPEKNYSTTEKELLAIVWAVQRLRQYLLGRKFIIQTDHQALTWLFNVKNPNSRLVRWIVILEEYTYEIEYKKGKENIAADALSRMYPINEIVKNQGHPMESKAIIDENYDQAVESITNNEGLSDGETQPIAERLRRKEPKNEGEIYRQYCIWKANRMATKIKLKPTTNGKKWIKISKRNVFSTLRIQLPDYDEKMWIELLYTKLQDFTMNKNWKIFKFHMEDPSITNIEKVRIKDMLDFLLQTKFEDNEFFLCERPDKSLSEGEKLNLLQEAHGNVATGHFGENKTIRRLREQISWENMEGDAIEFIKRCKTCQHEKLTRIR